MDGGASGPKAAAEGLQAESMELENSKDNVGEKESSEKGNQSVSEVSAEADGQARALETEEERKELEQSQITAAQLMLSRHQYLGRLPFIHEFSDLAKASREIAEKNPSSFNWGISFRPDFVGELMYNGFLTMCDRVGGKHEPNSGCILLPKLHVKRCLLSLNEIHIGKSTRRKAKKFQLSLDRAFNEVCAGIVRQHGENWFYPPLVETFRKMNKRGRIGTFGGRVKMHSFELWHEEKLVAGEVGYLCGAVYTALSGFSDMDSAGSVQMAGTGSFLSIMGVKLWDLGMGLPYKFSMGAKLVPRLEFLKIQNELRDIRLSNGHLNLQKSPVSDQIEAFAKSLG